MTKKTLSELARIVDERIQEISGYKSQKEVAEEVGFPSQNFISIIKAGGSKLALSRVPAMAKALDMDVETLMMAALKQYYDDETIEILRSVFSDAETETERDILGIARQNMDVKSNLSYDTRMGLAGLLKENKPAGA